MPAPPGAVLHLPLPVGAAIIQDVTGFHDDAHRDVINPFLNDWADPDDPTTWIPYSTVKGLIDVNVAAIADLVNTRSRDAQLVLLDAANTAAQNGALLFAAYNSGKDYRLPSGIFDTNFPALVKDGQHCFAWGCTLRQPKGTNLDALAGTDAWWSNVARSSGSGATNECGIVGLIVDGNWKSTTAFEAGNNATAAINHATTALLTVSGTAFPTTIVADNDWYVEIDRPDGPAFTTKLVGQTDSRHVTLRDALPGTLDLVNTTIRFYRLYNNGDNGGSGHGFGIAAQLSTFYHCHAKNTWGQLYLTDSATRGFAITQGSRSGATARVYIGPGHGLTVGMQIVVTDASNSEFNAKRGDVIANTAITVTAADQTAGWIEYTVANSGTIALAGVTGRVRVYAGENIQDRIIDCKAEFGGLSGVSNEDNGALIIGGSNNNDTYVDRCVLNFLNGRDYIGPNEAGHGIYSTNGSGGWFRENHMYGNNVSPRVGWAPHLIKTGIRLLNCQGAHVEANKVADFGYGSCPGDGTTNTYYAISLRANGLRPSIIIGNLCLTDEDQVFRQKAFKNALWCIDVNDSTAAPFADRPVTSTVTNAVRAGNVVTLTLSSATALTTGQQINVGLSDATLDLHDGVTTVTVIDATHVSYPQTGADVASEAVTGYVSHPGNYEPEGVLIASNAGYSRSNVKPNLTYGPPTTNFLRLRASNQAALWTNISGNFHTNCVQAFEGTNAASTEVCRQSGNSWQWAVGQPPQIGYWPTGVRIANVNAAADGFEAWIRSTAGTDPLGWVTTTQLVAASTGLITVSKQTTETVDTSLTTALHNDAELAVTLPVGNWKVRLMLYVNAPDAANIKLAMTGPGDALCEGGVNFGGLNTSATGSSAGRRTETYALTSGTAVCKTFAASTLTIPIEFDVKVVTSGIFHLQWSTANLTAGTMTIFARSSLIATKTHV